MKPTKCPAREKKNEAPKKSEKREGEKAKSKSHAHAWTTQADILHLDQKAVKCTTCERVCGKF